MKTHGIASHLLSTSTTKQITVWKLFQLWISYAVALFWATVCLWSGYAMVWLGYTISVAWLHCCGLVTLLVWSGYAVVVAWLRRGCGRVTLLAWPVYTGGVA